MTNRLYDDELKKVVFGNLGSDVLDRTHKSEEHERDNCVVISIPFVEHVLGFSDSVLFLTRFQITNQLSMPMHSNQLWLCGCQHCQLLKTTAMRFFCARFVHRGETRFAIAGLLEVFPATLFA